VTRWRRGVPKVIIPGATPAEARQMLALKGGENAGFEPLFSAQME